MVLARTGYGCVLILLLGLGFGSLGHAACSRFEFSGHVMGTRTRLICYASDRGAAESAWLRVNQRWQELDQIFSDYRPDSEIMRLATEQSTGINPPSPVSRDLFQLLTISQELSRRSRGAFDVTVGPVTRLWRQARRSGRLMPEDKLASARARVGYHYVELNADPMQLRFLKPGMRLDFGAIGKGYAADQALQVLREAGIRQALVGLGGDLALGDAPPDRPGWQVEVSPEGWNPPPVGNRPSLLAVNCGMATSGDSQQKLVQGGNRLSHILDPRSGRPLVNPWSVTVIAADCTQADGLATTLSVVGPTDGLPWIGQHYPDAAVQFHRPGADGGQQIANEPFRRYRRTEVAAPSQPTGD